MRLGRGHHPTGWHRRRRARPSTWVSREESVSVGTLERRRAQVLAAPGELANGQRLTPVALLEAVITTASMDEAARSAWCREQGLYPTELEAWKRDASKFAACTSGSRQSCPGGLRPNILPIFPSVRHLLSKSTP